ncbi:MAG: hypothetical protein M3P43_15045 [Actinomycetota bacterium]|nr:hypothetical protein [Actinomycetota bacterium]
MFDRSFLSWWAYGQVLGHDVSYMSELAARLERVPDVWVVLLTATAEELTRRFTEEPDHWFDLDQIIAANDRVPSIASLLPGGVPSLQIDTTELDIAQVYSEVRSFLGQ